jgi:hypothetical protein
LRAIADPDALDREAKIDQRRLIDLAGGEDAIRGKEMITYFPPPAV